MSSARGRRQTAAGRWSANPGGTTDRRTLRRFKLFLRHTRAHLCIEPAFKTSPPQRELLRCDNANVSIMLGKLIINIYVIIIVINYRIESWPTLSL